MTETELKNRLTASVDEIEAAPDVLDRVRQGGSRRLRRRRLTTLAVTTLAVMAVGGATLSGPAIYHQLTEPPVAGVPVKNDPYGFLMKGPTRGDLAGDQDYLDQALAAWQKSHRDSANRDRGIFDRMQGEPRVYWAGKTPGGRVAIIGQYSDLRDHDNIQLDREGVHTLVGFVADGTNGKPTVVADSYPAPGVSLITGFVTRNTLVVLDIGKKVGWSPAREYDLENGGSGRKYTSVQFKDGVGVVELPTDTDPKKLALHTLPAKGSSDLSVAGAGAELQGDSTPDDRLWSDLNGDGNWPMSPGAEQLASTARDTFGNAVGAVSDPDLYSAAHSIWIGYGVTADGSAVYLGEQQLDTDPTRVYAVLQPKNGKARVISGGEPKRGAALPVQIRLPGNQGWSVAAKDATLSYRYGEGQWSTTSKNALLIPHGEDVEVKVETPAQTETVNITPS
ncbi:hypothetical protein GCM10029976_063960 [Kribbella albertanoniae]|uniref:Uncharacterized protein n=1 Tax=Kribbella albertanoniae TaxID=1266829 RepID=A0A4R4P9L4_9ACTN|nr:hypothetical protein [Kribbella albertanoniae]TDC19231.1 hypothetical protein E1261_34355 [Kribbella albertanoniae]